MIDQVCISDSLLEGAKEVFETMVFMDLEEPSEPDEKIEGDALLSSITFKGNIEGCLAICCGVPCAKTIAVNMLGMELSEELSEEEICDALGEVANMVMGSVKARLEGSVGNLEVSIPSVVSGQDLENSLGEGATRILVKVNVENENIVEFSLICREKSE